MRREKRERIRKQGREPRETDAEIIPFTREEKNRVPKSGPPPAPSRPVARPEAPEWRGDLYQPRYCAYKKSHNAYTLCPQCDGLDMSEAASPYPAMDREAAHAGAREASASKQSPQRR